MIEVREMTLIEPSCARSVIKASVIPSEKYSWLGSAERFCNGSTAIERICGSVVLLVNGCQDFAGIRTTTAPTSAKAAIINTIPVRGFRLMSGVFAANDDTCVAAALPFPVTPAITG